MKRVGWVWVLLLVILLAVSPALAQEKSLKGSLNLEEEKKADELPALNQLAPIKGAKETPGVTGLKPEGARAISTSPERRTPPRKEERNARLTRSLAPRRTPRETLSPLDYSEDIYIYVTMLPSERPRPPENIWINDARLEPDDYIALKMSSYVMEADGYFVYRDTMPIFNITQCTPSIRIAAFSGALDFTDNLDDPRAEALGPGIADTAVNWFYVITSYKVDVVSGDTIESYAPSNCVGEFDFRVYDNYPTRSSYNWITYVVDGLGLGTDTSSVNFGKKLSEALGGGVYLVMEFNAATQTWSTLAESTFVPFPTPHWEWIGAGYVHLGYPYMFSGQNFPGTLLSFDKICYLPNHEGNEPHWQLYHHTDRTSYNWISLPFQEQFLARITTGVELLQDIIVAGGYDPETDGYVAPSLMRWNALSQGYVSVAEWLFIPFPTPHYEWTNHENVKAGYPSLVKMGATIESWPM